MPLDDMFWGDRYGKLEDPFGHNWSIGTHVRDVSPEEMQKAMANGRLTFEGPYLGKVEKGRFLILIALINPQFFEPDQRAKSSSRNNHPECPLSSFRCCVDCFDPPKISDFSEGRVFQRNRY